MKDHHIRLIWTEFAVPTGQNGAKLLTCLAPNHSAINLPQIFACELATMRFMARTASLLVQVMRIMTFSSNAHVSAQEEDKHKRAS